MITMGKIVFEKFDSVSQFMDAITSRKNNAVMRKKNSSHRDEPHNGNEWFGGYSWDGALEALSRGIPETVSEIRQTVAKVRANYCQKLIPHRKTINHYYGHAPNVPAAIVGLPKTMRHREVNCTPVKTVRIIHSAVANCDVDSEKLDKAGKCVLSLVYHLERSGYRVELYSAIKNSKGDKERTLCLVKLKSFQSGLNLSKVSFPMTSTAMFRRFGFRWLETVPGLSDQSFSRGYGYSEGRGFLLESLTLVNFPTDETYVSDVGLAKSVNFDPMELGKKLGVLK